MDTPRRYTIEPRPAHLGGGWRLRLLEDGEERGGGVFPPVSEAGNADREAYADAIAEGDSWAAER